MACNSHDCDLAMPINFYLLVFSSQGLYHIATGNMFFKVITLYILALNLIF